MILMFLSAFLAVIFGQLFTINFSIQGLDRAIINAPIELFVNGITEDEDTIKYDKKKLEESFNFYYSKVLPRYTKDYQVGYYYYNIEDGSMCLDNYCSAVEVTVNCKLIISYQYSRTMYYELRSK